MSNITSTSVKIMRAAAACALAAAAALAAAQPAWAAYRGYDDVSPSHWAVKAGVVDYALDNGLVKGTSDTTLSLDAPINRAQVACILYNAAGKPAGPANSTFSDDDKLGYARLAVAWAQQEGVVHGAGGRFDPWRSISREEACAMVANYYAPDAQLSEGDLSAFSDAGKVSAWARGVVSWAVDNGVLHGSDGKLDPRGNCTRAQFCTLAKNAAELDAAKDDELADDEPADDGDGTNTGGASEKPDIENGGKYDAETLIEWGVPHPQSEAELDLGGNDYVLLANEGLHYWLPQAGEGFYYNSWYPSSWVAASGNEWTPRFSVAKVYDGTYEVDPEATVTINGVTYVGNGQGVLDMLATYNPITRSYHIVATPAVGEDGKYVDNPFGFYGTLVYDTPPLPYCSPVSVMDIRCPHCGHDVLDEAGNKYYNYLISTSETLAYDIAEKKPMASRLASSFAGQEYDTGFGMGDSYIDGKRIGLVLEELKASGDYESFEYWDVRADRTNLDNDELDAILVAPWEVSALNLRCANLNCSHYGEIVDPKIVAPGVYSAKFYSIGH